MNLTMPVTDNITDILIKVIEFTVATERVLQKNIQNVNQEGYIPLGFEVEDFCHILNIALDEHLRTKRLVLIDTDSIKFGESGNFALKAVPDDKARQLRLDDADGYLEQQMNRLMENKLNQNVAKHILKQKEGLLLSTEL
jgi:flagellar basal body rod protein FlgB